jgi:tRNA dimethylallyltransferase
MDTGRDKPLIVIVGQTASGKTALAMDLAKRFSGEIIAADSRTVYKGMDIGTAKPTTEQQRTARHHLIDIVEPDQRFSAADFQRLAREAIEDIHGRGKIPIMVGGTGLYVDSLVYGFEFSGPPNLKLREDLELLSTGELQDLLKSMKIEMPADPNNPRHLVRSIETGGIKGGRHDLRLNTLLIGVEYEDPTSIESRIRGRVDEMVDAGFIDEVRDLANRYGWGVTSMQAPGYRAFRQYLSGQLSLDEAKQQFVRNDMQYAKRQKTWFKRNKDINWISKSEEAVELLTTFLNK